MANLSPYTVGGFRIPTGFEDVNNKTRVYVGAGNPNKHMLSAAPFFVPPPRPGDRYLQIDIDPVIEWVFIKSHIWVELSTRYDHQPPDGTDILEIIKVI